MRRAELPQTEVGSTWVLSTKSSITNMKQSLKDIQAELGQIGSKLDEISKSRKDIKASCHNIAFTQLNRKALAAQIQHGIVKERKVMFTDRRFVGRRYEEEERNVQNYLSSTVLDAQDKTEDLRRVKSSPFMWSQGAESVATKTSSREKKSETVNTERKSSVSNDKAISAHARRRSGNNMLGGERTGSAESSRSGSNSSGSSEKTGSSSRLKYKSRSPNERAGSSNGHLENDSSALNGRPGLSSSRIPSNSNTLDDKVSPASTRQVVMRPNQRLMFSSRDSDVGSDVHGESVRNSFFKYNSSPNIRNFPDHHILPDTDGGEEFYGDAPSPSSMRELADEKKRAMSVPAKPTNRGTSAGHSCDYLPHMRKRTVSFAESTFMTGVSNASMGDFVPVTSPPNANEDSEDHLEDSYDDLDIEERVIYRRASAPQLPTMLDVQYSPKKYHSTPDFAEDFGTFLTGVYESENDLDASFDGGRGGFSRPPTPRTGVSESEISLSYPINGREIVVGPSSAQPGPHKPFNESNEQEKSKSDKHHEVKQLRRPPSSRHKLNFRLNTPGKHLENTQLDQRRTSSLPYLRGKSARVSSLRMKAIELRKGISLDSWTLPEEESTEEMIWFSPQTEEPHEGSAPLKELAVPDPVSNLAAEEHQPHEEGSILLDCKESAVEKKTADASTERFRGATPAPEISSVIAGRNEEIKYAAATVAQLEEIIAHSYTNQRPSLARSKQRHVMPFPSVVNVNQQFDMVKGSTEKVLSNVVWTTRYILDEDKSFIKSQPDMYDSQEGVKEDRKAHDFLPAVPIIPIPSLMGTDAITPLPESLGTSEFVVQDIHKVDTYMPEDLLKDGMSINSWPATNDKTTESVYPIRNTSPFGRVKRARSPLKVPIIDPEVTLVDYCLLPRSATPPPYGQGRRKDSRPSFSRGHSRVLNVVQLDECSGIEAKFLLARPGSGIWSSRPATASKQSKMDISENKEGDIRGSVGTQSLYHNRNILPITNIGIGVPPVETSKRPNSSAIRTLIATSEGWCTASGALETTGDFVEAGIDRLSSSPQHRYAEGKASPILKDNLIQEYNSAPPFSTPDPELSINATRLQYGDPSSRCRTPRLKFEVLLPLVGAPVKKKKKKKIKKPKKKRKDRKKDVIEVPSYDMRLQEIALPAEVVEIVPESDSDISTERSLDLSYDIDPLMSRKIDRMAEHDDVMVMHLPPPWAFLVLKVAIYIRELLSVLQRSIRSFLQRKAFLNLRDTVRYAQRMFRARRVRLQYQRLIQLKRTGRNMKLALKQFERIDLAAEITGDGNYISNPPLRSAIHDRSQSISGSNRSVDLPWLNNSLLSLDDNSKSTLDSVRNRVKCRIRKAEKVVDSEAVFEEQATVWKTYWKFMASLEERYPVFVERISTVKTKVLRGSVWNDFAYFIKAYDENDEEEVAACMERRSKMNIASDIELQFLSYAFAIWVDRDFELIRLNPLTEPVLSPPALRRLAKMKNRKLNRLKRYRTAIFELRERMCPEYLCTLLKKE